MAVHLLPPTAEVTWTLVPEGPPALLKRCRRCDVERPFRSSGRFRLNAQKRRVDVWLVYLCEICSASWNVALYQRRTPQQIPELDRLHENDAALAERFASELAARPASRSRPVSVRVERPAIEAPQAFRMRVEGAARIRLDRLLAGELRLSRSKLEALWRKGRLRVAPDVGRPLRRDVQPGMLVVWLGEDTEYERPESHRASAATSD